MGEAPCTLYDRSTGGQPAVVVPTNGVIVGWRLNSGSVGNLAALQVLRPTGPNFTGAGTSAQVTVTSLGLREYATRLPVKAGDVLGLQNADDGLFMEASATADVGAFKPPPADGGVGRPVDGVDPGRRLLIEAVLEPDADGDGFGDESQDGCPTNPLVQTSGCPATATSPATPGIQARLSLSPNPTCTGVRTFFDMSGSTTPNPPITDYRLTYQELPFPVYISLVLGVGLEGVVFGFFGGGTALVESNAVETATDRFLATQPSFGLYEGLDSSYTSDFTWNRSIKGSPYQKFETGQAIGADISGYARDPMVVTLTVRDRTGSSSRVSSFLEFAQVYSSGRYGVSRAGCPKVRVQQHAYGFTQLSTASLSAKTIAVTIPCATNSPCAGNFSAFRTGTASASVPRVAPSTTKTVPAKPVLIAGSDFFTVPGKSSATVRAKLTKAGRRLARRGMPMPVDLRLTSINPETGRGTTRTSHLMLPKGSRSSAPTRSPTSR